MSTARFAATPTGEMSPGEWNAVRTPTSSASATSLRVGVRPPTAEVCSRSRSMPPSRISRTASVTEPICSPTAIGTGEAERTSGSRS